ncbi:MAG: hypothetical protein ABIH86_05655 [Planctomycetota bacterium]
MTNDFGGSLKKCYKCGKILEISASETVSFSLACEACGSWVHCCMNCNFNDENARSGCREPNADFVSDKRGRNTCEYFAFIRQRGSRPPEQRRKENEMNRGGKSGWKSNYGGGGRRDDGRSGGPQSGGGGSGDPRAAREKIEKLFSASDSTPKPPEADNPREKLEGIFQKPVGSSTGPDFSSASPGSPYAARRKLNQLFNDKPASSEEEEKRKRDPKGRLEDLFKKKSEEKPKADKNG